MPDLVVTILLLFGLLQVKHMLADFFLQTRRMLSGRGTYLHLGRMQHAAVHSVLSFGALVAVGTDVFLAVALGLAEWIIHFHLDWAKARYSEKRALQPTQALYWYAFGVDQLLHQMTYVAMVWVWVLFAL